MTPDEYMTVLLERQAAHEQDNPGACPPLLEWLVRDADTEVFTAPKQTPPRRQPSPKFRKNIPAAVLRDYRARLVTERDAIDSALPDTAAAGGVGIGKHRATAQNARMDTALTKYTDLTTRIRNLDGRITRAEMREAK